MSHEAIELWWMARSDHLRADPQVRSRVELIFAAKGYTPRKQGNIFEPDSAANSQLPGEEHA